MRVFRVPHLSWNLPRSYFTDVEHYLDILQQFATRSLHAIESGVHSGIMIPLPLLNRNTSGSAHGTAVISGAATLQ